ncbi:MAG: hypothetical protein PHS04_09825 [Tissierellia bacterium]|nr:hypothetical protein [Tissierellia bacterium]
MKTIEVTVEMYEFLKSLQHELLTQDNRGTKKPYFYNVQEKIEVAVPEGCGDKVWVCDGEYLRNAEDVKKAVFEWKEWDLTNEDDCTKYNQLNDWEIDSILEENYRKGYVSIDYRYSNCFLTEKACREHIDINRHNLTSPRTYLDYAFRNTEMENLIKFLEEIKFNESDE